MRAVVIFESMFGSTELIARAIAEGLAANTEVVNVDDAPADFEGVDLLVAGGPTHVHGMSRPSTRKGALDQATDGIRSRRMGLREWLDSLGRANADTYAAVFDTRLDKPRWLVGSAARGAAARLRRRGYRMLAKPESFFVDGGTPGELLPGELDRAREWARAIAADSAAKA